MRVKALHFEKIQVLRAVAANGVVLSHLLIVEHKYGHGFAVLPAWAHLGSSGVDLFFVISGFIMSIIAGSASWKDFIIARATRIYPPYWFYTTAVLMVWLAAPSVVNNSLEHTPSLWRSYFLIPDSVYPLLAVGWTLIHEMYFYVVLTVILAAGVSQKFALIGWGLAVIILSSIFPHISRDSSPLLSILIHPLTIEFILGALVGLAIRSGMSRYGWQALAAGIILFVLACVTADDTTRLVDTADWHHVLVFGLPFTLIVYGAAACEKKGGPPPKLLVSLGDASYSTYLGHVLILSAIGRLFMAYPLHGFTTETVFVAICLGSVNALALVSYRFMERPSLRYARRFTESLRERVGKSGK